MRPTMSVILTDIAQRVRTAPLSRATAASVFDYEAFGTAYIQFIGPWLADMGAEQLTDVDRRLAGEGWQLGTLTPEVAQQWFGHLPAPAWGQGEDGAS